jgi:hypothetical protein
LNLHCHFWTKTLKPFLYEFIFNFQMASSKGFLCLMIVNESFEDSDLGDRKNAVEQATALKESLEDHLLCDIIMKFQLTATEMQTCVEDCKSNKFFLQYISCI